MKTVIFFKIRSDYKISSEGFKFWIIIENGKDDNDELPSLFFVKFPRKRRVFNTNMGYSYSKSIKN